MDRKRNRLIFLLLSFLTITSCNHNEISSSKSENENKESKILLAYFSRAGENYGVGYVEKGNTEIIANYINELVKCDKIFKIEREEDYPLDYNSCTKVAKAEKDENARPKLKSYMSEDDFSTFDIVFLGYPIWYNSMPMPVYTFIESYSFEGKVVYPFSTNEGSGFGDTIGVLKNKLTKAILKDGYSTKGQYVNSKKDEVSEWLTNLKMGEK